MARNYVFSIGEYYHVYNRGTDKRKIFLNKKDYERFQFLLYICNNTKPIIVRDYIGLTSADKFNLLKEGTLVDIGAYCLMPNHFHLLLKEKVEGGISLFMQKLMTGYTMYFNTANDRTGTLFEGSFKARHADEDRYLEYLYAYIHLNPIKLIEPEWKERGIQNETKGKEFLMSYRYSSYLDFININRAENNLLSRKAFPGYFQTESSFDNFISGWMENNEFTEV